MERPIVNRFKDSHEVTAKVAADLLAFVSLKLSEQDRVDLAVTGGSLGIATLASASLLDFSNLELDRLHIWWGDERFVETNSPDRNCLQASTAWFSKLNIPQQNLHEFPASDGGFTLDEAAVNFAKYFDGMNIAFDLMLMGMGPDGHIASLFPGHTEGDAGSSVIAEHNSPKPPPERLSFNFATINKAKEIWFTVSGADKAEAVSVVFGDDSTSLPAGRIRGTEKTVWYLDQTAGNTVWGC